MRYPNAIQRPGPASKTGYDGLTSNACRGVVCHSMVGSYTSAMGELDNLARRASWCFSVLQSGSVIQHYDSAAVTWHADSKRANGLYIGIEHEGGLSPFSEPLTPAQAQASVELVRWLAQGHGFPLVRKVALWEHREMASTACPSGRIPWHLYTEEEEDDMKPLLVWNIDKQAVFLVGPFGAVWVTDAADVPALEGLYGKMTVALHDSTLRQLLPK